MHRVHKCPDCGVQLTSSMKHRGGGEYTEVWTCSNFENHGSRVPCANECGALVRNPREHYYSTAGLIGSGRWSCIPQRTMTQFTDRWKKALEELEGGEQ